MRKTTFATIVLVFLNLNSRCAEISPAGKLFLLPPGARAVGLGGCGTLLGEAYSGLYNPAAQALTADVTGAFYLNPHPSYGPNRDFYALVAGAHSEFGYIGFSYMVRDGIDNTDYPPEETTALVIAGKASRKINLLFGAAFKILVTLPQFASFAPLNATTSKSYKMAFDLGVVYYSLLPAAPFGKETEWTDEQEPKSTHSFLRGLTFGLAFQNLGGEVEYENSLYPSILPQTFRADLLWGVYEGTWWNLRATGQLQKLLVARVVEDGQGKGYKSAANALMSAWGGGGHEGGWTARLGLELSAFSLISGRMGWSVDHGDHRSFTYAGLGLGPDWLRGNLAWEHEPDSGLQLDEELRYDVTANVTYEQIRKWMGQE